MPCRYLTLHGTDPTARPRTYRAVLRDTTSHVNERLPERYSPTFPEGVLLEVHSLNLAYIRCCKEPRATPATAATLEVHERHAVGATLRQQSTEMKP
jgi:hypothetical protein